MTSGELGRLPVVFFESRRAEEMASLITRHGGIPVAAPALREVRSAAGSDAAAFAEELEQGRLDLVLLLTGVGTRALAEEVSPVMSRERFAAALRRAQVIARGPKPAVALRELGVDDFMAVPSPNTWREILAALDGRFGVGGLAGKRMAVQEYGVPNEELYGGLRARGVHIMPVRVYTYALPDDVGPLRRALEMLARREAEVALFTSRAQVEHALLVAAEGSLDAEVRAALSEGVVASIGPVCSEALRAEGLAPDIEATPPKMGHLVKDVAARSLAILAEKRAARGARQ